MLNRDPLAIADSAARTARVREAGARDSNPSYRPDIDGLRAAAVLAVIGFHAFPGYVRGGFVGVDVFFVISGFLISSLLFVNLEKGSFRFSEFYGRRIKRIFPALILVLAVCLAFGWFALLADVAASARPTGGRKLCREFRRLQTAKMRR
jgi:peptidoglycan/LPS O-acetylase OafA/YrhL